MRPWIAHLISSNSAHNDFHNWTVGAVADLNKSLLEAVHSGDIEKARGIAHELKVYENLQKSVKCEVREQSAQAIYTDQMKGDEK